MLRLHHIGMVVQRLADAQALLERFLEAEAEGPPVDDEAQQATVQMFRSGGVILELIAPLGDDSHVHNLLKRSGEGLAHLCYETDDLDGTIAGMRQNGALLISRKPAKAFDGRDVAFVFLPNRMVVELVST